MLGLEHRSENLSRVRTSEDKVRRKDLCGSVRAVYVLEKLPDVSGPGLIEAGRYKLGTSLLCQHISSYFSLLYLYLSQKCVFSKEGTCYSNLLLPVN